MLLGAGVKHKERRRRAERDVEGCEEGLKTEITVGLVNSYYFLRSISEAKYMYLSNLVSIYQADPITVLVKYLTWSIGPGERKF